MSQCLVKTNAPYCNCHSRRRANEGGGQNCHFGRGPMTSRVGLCPGVSYFKLFSKEKSSNKNILHSASEPCVTANHFSTYVSFILVCMVKKFWQNPEEKSVISLISVISVYFLKKIIMSAKFYRFFGKIFGGNL